MAKSKEKIRVHNQGKREYTIPAENKGGKKRMILPGRAIELEKAIAEKMIKAYPRDLVEFDSLVSGEKKNLNKENARMESLNKTLTEENDQFKLDNQELKDKIDGLPKLEDADPDTKKLLEENKVLGEKIIDLEVALENSNQIKSDEKKGG